MPFSSLPSPPPTFPTYLVPSLPFRRRKSSTDSDISTSSTASSASSNTSSTYLSPTPTSHLRCARCLADLALSTQIISKGFTGRHGRAYLVSPSLTTPTILPNTHVHRPVPRLLVTGPHTVGDIACSHCGSVLGWKYVAAEQEEQRYKVGKYILETKRVCRTATWDGVADESESGGIRGSGGGDQEEIEFDSQDEDECDALFSGHWTSQVAREIRKGKKRNFQAKAGAA